MGIQVAPTTERLTKVYVTNYAGHDYKEAERFGKIVYVTRGFVSFQSLDRLKFVVAEALIDSNKDDYVLLSGTTLICSLACMIWLELHEKVKILNWDKKTREYRVLVVTKEDLAKLFDVLKPKADEA